MKMMGMMATASMLQAYRSGMASDYTTVSGISKGDALAAMDKETWYTNEETVDAGFASKVLGDSEAKASATCSGRIVMPENAIVTALTTPRKKTYALPERVAAVVAQRPRVRRPSPCRRVKTWPHGWNRRFPKMGMNAKIPWSAWPMLLASR